MPNLLANFPRTHIRTLSGYALADTIFETRNSFFHSRHHKVLQLLLFRSVLNFVDLYEVDAHDLQLVQHIQGIFMYWWQETCMPQMAFANAIVRKMHSAIIITAHKITLQKVTCSLLIVSTWFLISYTNNREYTAMHVYCCTILFVESIRNSVTLRTYCSTA